MMLQTGVLLPPCTHCACVRQSYHSARFNRALQRSAALRSTHRRCCRSKAMFKFKNPLQSGAAAKDAGPSREDYTEEDVEAYFNYMGMLAAEGTYDRLEQMLQSGIEPVDLLLLMTASENDAPKTAELLRAGADLSVKDAEGRTAEEIATSEAVKELLQDRTKAFSY